MRAVFQHNLNHRPFLFLRIRQAPLIAFISFSGSITMLHLERHLNRHVWVQPV